LPPTVHRARLGVLALFFASGIAVASGPTRLIMIQEQLAVGAAQTGLLILSFSLGAVTFMPLSSVALGLWSKASFIRATALVCSVALVAMGAFATGGFRLGAYASFFVVGACAGPWDVAMNVAGTEVERAMGRSVMPQFHASFSLGTVMSAGLGALAAWAKVPLTVHFGLAAVLALGLVWWGVLGLAATSQPPQRPERRTGRRSAGAMVGWREPHTWLIGIVVLAAGLIEGSANDWLALGIRQDFQVPEAIGILGLGAFLCAMTAMRMLGTGLVDRYGRAAVQRMTAVLALAGLAAYTLAPNLVGIMAGAALWGLGSAMGFPLGLSAAADDPAKAAARTSTVATIGYSAALAGPGLLGLLADHVGYRPALMVMALPATFALVLAPVLRPRPPRPSEH